MKKSLEKHYDKLTREERVELIMSASKRDDRTEVKRLLMSVPKDNTTNIKVQFEDPNWLDNSLKGR